MQDDISEKRKLNPKTGNKISKLEILSRKMKIGTLFRIGGLGGLREDGVGMSEQKKRGVKNMRPLVRPGYIIMIRPYVQGLRNPGCRGSELILCVSAQFEIESETKYQ